MVFFQICLPQRTCDLLTLFYWWCFPLYPFTWFIELFSSNTSDFFFQNFSLCWLSHLSHWVSSLNLGLMSSFHCPESSYPYQSYWSSLPAIFGTQCLALCPLNAFVLFEEFTCFGGVMLPGFPVSLPSVSALWCVYLLGWVSLLVLCGSLQSDEI